MIKYTRFILLGLFTIALILIITLFMGSTIKISNYEAVITLNEQGDMNVVERWDMTYNEVLSVRFRDIKFNKYGAGYPLEISVQNTADFDENQVSIRVFQEGIDITNQVRLGYSFLGDRDELGYLITCEPASSSCESLFVDFTNVGGLFGNITFEYEYNILGAITSYSDIAELNWRLFDYMEADIEQASVEVHFPSNTYSVEDIYVWGHGLSKGTIEIVANDFVKMTIDKIKKTEFLEFRILAPTSLFPDIATKNIFINPNMNLQRLIDYESNLAIETNRRITIASIVLGSAVATMVGMIIITINVYRKYDKEYTPDFQGDYYRELPSDETPAEMSYLYYMQKINDEDFTATLLDLVRRKFIRLDYQGTELTSKDADFTLTFIPETNQSSLLPHEQHLLKWIFNVIGNNKQVTTQQIENYGKGNVTKAERFQSEARNFVRLAKKAGEKRHYFEEGLSANKSKVMGFVIIPVFVFLIALYTRTNYYLDNMLALILMAVTIVSYGIYIASIKKRSRSGNESYAKWKAFRNFLLDFGNMKDYPMPGIIVWEHYLVYATSLKIADTVMEQLKVRLPEVSTDASEGTFLSTGYRSRGFYYGYALGRVQRSFTTAKTNSFQTIAAHNAQKVSSGGRGGGFGGGSSFGGGGGGGRSR